MNLPAAEMPSFFQRRKIKKFKIEGFLDFIGKAARQKHLGNMRFPGFDGAHRMRIKTGPVHGLEDRLLGGAAHKTEAPNR